MSDDDLRQRFAELKRRDTREAPEFETMWKARAPRARSPWRVVVPIASVTAAAAMVVLWWGAAPLAEHAPAPAATPVSSLLVAREVVLDPAPLDFLLEMPESTSLAMTSELGPNPHAGW